MGKICSVPKEVGPKPELDYKASHEDFRASLAAEEAWVEKIKDYARQRGSGDCKGEELRFGVADGYARYIVFSTKPVQLIHLPVGDAWRFQYANRLTAKDVKEQVERERSWRKIFKAK